MARYHASMYARERKRRVRRFYGIVILVVAAAVLGYLHFRQPGDSSPAEANALEPSSYSTGSNDTEPEVRHSQPLGSLDNTAQGRTEQVSNTAFNDVATSAADDILSSGETDTSEVRLAQSQSVGADESKNVLGLRAAEIIAQADELLNQKPSDIIAARDKLARVLDMPVSEKTLSTVKQKLSKLADDWLFSRNIYAQDSLCGSYMVEQGDRLSQIGEKFKVPYELLMQINNISDPLLLAAGKTIKVVNGPFNARIDRSEFKLDIYLQDTYIKSFQVGLGAEGMETPTGLWVVRKDGKLIKPAWPDPVSGKILHYGHPDYALGVRWIALKGVQGNAVGRTGFGIHGTNNPEQLGTRCSRGCIRMLNEEVTLVYKLLTPVHSEVKIVD